MVGPIKSLRNIIKEHLLFSNNISNINFIFDKVFSIKDECNTINQTLYELFILNNNDNTLNNFISFLINNDYNSIFRVIHSLWFKHYDNKLLIRYFEFFERIPNIWYKINNRFWLIYIAVLYENNYLDKAKNILINYFDKFQYLDIHRVLFVSKLAVEMYISNDDIIKSSLILDAINDSRGKNEFEDFIKGKRVAIVGNGPQEIGKGRGKEIDSYDIIVRFNNFNLDGFEEDYGSKTDVWCKNGNIHLNGEKRIVNNMIFWLADVEHYILFQDHVLNNLYEDIFYSNLPVSFLTTKIRVSHKKEIDVHYLTSGGLMINYIYQIKKKYNELFTYNDIYGFSFLNNDFDISIYHFYKDNLLVNADSFKNWHNIDLEIKFFRKLFALDKDIKI